MNVLVQRSDVGEFRRRYRWMILSVIATFLVLTGKLVQLQLIESDQHRATATATSFDRSTWRRRAE